MMKEQKEMSGQESLQLITEMISKAKASYHETGVSALLWGTAVFIASFVTFAKEQFGFKLPFDIWLIVLLAIIPQIVISIRESRQRKVVSYDDRAVGLVWTVYAITLAGLIIYQNIAPGVAEKMIRAEGWQTMKHWLNGQKPDEPLKPYVLSFGSIFMLIYAMPTMLTGLIKRFRPMIIGALLTYGFFFVSLFTTFKYDMLLSAATALVCWFIPGVLLRMRYLKRKQADV